MDWATKRESMEGNVPLDGLLFPPTSGATFSQCGNYRYKLWRIWDSSKPMIAFIGLNPSTANATSDDPTIRRVKGFAKQWGYGGVYMLNLFGIISSDPSILLTANDPIGDNDRYLLEAAIDGLRVVFAWGSFKQIGERDKDVIAMFPNAICLKKSGAGKPWHPLYVKADIQPIYFNSELPWKITYH